MSKNAKQTTAPGDVSISWDRVRAIFGNPKSPSQVWERQFDYFDDQLQRLAQTAYDQIDFRDLWYYYHDLAYVELQPEVFGYLFPVCLMDWHQTLMKSEPCSHGDSEFHYGVHRGNVFQKMMAQPQRTEVSNFFKDSFLNRLDAERGLTGSSDKTLAYAWIYRFNSLGLIVPTIDSIWKAWWSFDTPGRAVAALEYCAGLMYFGAENPLLGQGAADKHRNVPCLRSNDSSIYHAGWLTPNIDFLVKTLSTAFVNDRVAQAVNRLRGEPEYEKARRLLEDLPNCQELIEARICELPSLLADPNAESAWFDP